MLSLGYSAKDIGHVRPLADLRYLAQTSRPIPDVLMQEAHKLIEADKANTPAVA